MVLLTNIPKSTRPSVQKPPVNVGLRQRRALQNGIGAGFPGAAAGLPPWIPLSRHPRSLRQWLYAWHVVGAQWISVEQTSRRQPEFASRVACVRGSVNILGCIGGQMDKQTPSTPVAPALHAINAQKLFTSRMDGRPHTTPGGGISLQ